MTTYEQSGLLPAAGVGAADHRAPGLEAASREGRDLVALSDSDLAAGARDTRRLYGARDPAAGVGAADHRAPGLEAASREGRDLVALSDSDLAAGARDTRRLY